MSGYKLTPEQLAVMGENRGPLCLGINVAFMVVGAAFVALRLLSRKVVGLSLKSDDYLSIVALIGYAYEQIYGITLGLVKLSVLLVYHRVFITPAFKKALYIMAGLIVAKTIAFEFVVLFQCHPISDTWNLGDSRNCINFDFALTFSSTFNMVSDFAILILPLPVVWTLKISRRKKVILTGVFCIGIFACVSSIVRLITLRKIIDSPTDFSYSYAELNIWSMIECSSALICACIPTLAPLFRGALGGNLTTPGNSGLRSTLVTRPAPNATDFEAQLNKTPFTKLEISSEASADDAWKSSSSKSKMVTAAKAESASSNKENWPMNAIRVKSDVEWSST
ncbi:MAG: hypothetical protein M1829_001947 [Trizodia sp. TS-e1964]|nr:MAG: hypothetical protein M1829_001947 [Trizodia sp. TS-e1964]